MFIRKFSAIPDAIILMLFATLIYGLVRIGHEYRSDFHSVTKIDLSIWALPTYTLLSAIRGITAYVLSLIFTLIVGYAAARSAKAERVIIPTLDILQSIPVLGFLPGLVLGLVALFPRTNTGLELAAIIMIFTGQVWNMTFSYYASLKSIPSDFMEASTVIGLNWYQRLVKLELPFSAVNLAWNSLMSMAGGWFFLSACEAFTLGDHDYRLPGIGSYMAIAVAEGNRRAMIAGIIAMVLLIVIMDFAIWRPLLTWVQRFRLEDVPGVAPEEPLMGLFIRESRLLRWVKLIYRRYRFEQREHAAVHSGSQGQGSEALQPVSLQDPVTASGDTIKLSLQRKWHFSPGALRAINFLLTWGSVVLALYGGWRLFQMIAELSWGVWVVLIRNAFWSFMRVLVSLFLSTLWAVPAGIWIGTNSRRLRIAQPIIQVLASFPAPMLYPLGLALLFALGINFDWGSMFLLMLGTQWYVLFNVLAGALRVPQELTYATALMDTSTWDRWWTLYIPSVFPALVTGWVTAAGGAWNATILAEFILYRGSYLQTSGLGATISMAAASQNMPVLAASLSLMVVIVILLNRTVWSRIYGLASTRYRMD
ncbi:MAG: ABC transporter permease subunit [Oligoflexia bacterium]|nr:ABC transporter permease subunit [Oligoflexia bacterium]